MNAIDFWFSIGSTYSYLTVMRLHEIEKRIDARFNWRPFSVRALMKEMNNIPFVGKPTKEKYMWHDIQRRAQRYGIPIKVPVAYPLQHFDLANLIAVVAKQEGWCQEYACTTYRNWFQNSMPAGEEPNISQTLEEIGQPMDRVLQLANSETIAAAYMEATSEARVLGIFGSPSFIVNGQELFWGDDRLEDAIEYWRDSK